MRRNFICNGFQALVKSGLLPYGRLGMVTKDSPTLFRNDIIATFARIFAEQRINVEGLKAFRIEDDQSLQVFEVVIPEQVDTRSLHRIMGERAKRMGLRLSMQHAAIFEAIHRVRVV